MTLDYWRADLELTLYAKVKQIHSPEQECRFHKGFFLEKQYLKEGMRFEKRFSDYTLKRIRGLTFTWEGWYLKQRIFDWIH